MLVLQVTLVQQVGVDQTQYFQQLHQQVVEVVVEQLQLLYREVLVVEEVQ